jgi:hypothetical protein
MDERLGLCLQNALQELISACPRVKKECYWAGTSAIALEELHHRDSFDLDLHTILALQDTGLMLAEVQKAFAERFSLIEPPSPYGSGFQGLLKIPSGEELTVQLMANFEDIPLNQLSPSRLVPGIRRVGLAKYLRDKLTCLVERAEARDLLDVMAVLDQRPAMLGEVRRFLVTLDEILLTERLLNWSESAIAIDLKAYPNSRPEDAIRARDLLLGLLEK